MNEWMNGTGGWLKFLRDAWSVSKQKNFQQDTEPLAVSYYAINNHHNGDRMAPSDKSGQTISPSRSPPGLLTYSFCQPRMSYPPHPVTLVSDMGSSVRDMLWTDIGRDSFLSHIQKASALRSSPSGSHVSLACSGRLYFCGNTAPVWLPVGRQQIICARHCCCARTRWQVVVT